MTDWASGAQFVGIAKNSSQADAYEVTMSAYDSGTKSYLVPRPRTVPLLRRFLAGQDEEDLFAFPFHDYSTRDELANDYRRKYGPRAESVSELLAERENPS